jgi:hypothetical protein
MTDLTATGYQLGSSRVPFPHLGTFATADDAHDAGELLGRVNGRSYYLHVLLSDGSDRPVAIQLY